MAELNYNDAYRAAHDATKDIRDMLGRVLHQSDRINELHLQLLNLQRATDESRRSLTSLAGSINLHQRPQPHQPGGIDTAQLQHIIEATQRLETRIQHMESYLHDISEYFSVLRQQQLEQLRNGTKKRTPRNNAANKAA